MSDTINCNRAPLEHRTHGWCRQGNRANSDWRGQRSTPEQLETCNHRRQFKKKTFCVESTRARLFTINSHQVSTFHNLFPNGGEFKKRLTIEELIFPKNRQEGY
ncbi:hypothetical protein RUM44_010196 [Polyplax serrata]|uniref:Uncharacterized protein n=1 Tax=Polyplax serrata TaxID=468196 RepID=A0ABR1AUV8_POLSC